MVSKSIKEQGQRYAGHEPNNNNNNSHNLYCPTGRGPVTGQAKRASINI